MHLIKLSATDSTNAYLKRLCAEGQLPDLTIVWTLNQTAGRGQPGRTWVSEPGKNLTFSILKYIEALPAQDQFLINIWASLAVYKVLADLGLPDVTTKWPNDIMSGNRKLCGILPENSLKGEYVVRSVIGMGLNVNQAHFEDLPNATSMTLATGRTFELEPLLIACREAVSAICGSADAFDFEIQRKRYEAILFRKDQPTQFTREGASFTGRIRGIDREGKLRIEKEDGSLQAYGFRQIQML